MLELVLGKFKIQVACLLSLFLCLRKRADKPTFHISSFKVHSSVGLCDCRHMSHVGD
jgi:hypothetical protein